jgi:polysaccharide transporter, PST family
LPSIKNYNLLEQFSKAKRIALKERNVFYNALSLYLLQGLNYILPLLLLPYLTRIIGVDGYGLFSFAQSFILYFACIVTYGFNLTAARQATQMEGNKDSLEKLVSEIIIVRILLYLATIVLISIIIFATQKFRIDFKSYYIASILLIGIAFSLDWFFLGLQKLKYLAIINISCKLLFTLLIFLFVKEKSQINIAIFLSVIGNFIASIICLLFVRYKFRFRLKIPQLTDIIKQLKLSLPIFLSQISIVLFTGINVVILKLLSDDTEVGNYLIAERIFVLIAGFFVPISNVMLPRLSQIAQNRDAKEFNNVLKKIMLIILVASLICFVILFLLSGFIVDKMIGIHSPTIENNIRIFALVLIFAPFGGLLTNLAIIQNKNYFFLKATIITAIINLLVAFPLIKLYGSNGAVFSLLISYAFVMLYLYIGLLVKKPKIQ